MHCNARSDNKVHPDTFVKLSTEWLKIDKQHEGGFDSVKGFVREFVNYNVIAFDIYISLILEKDILSKVDIVEGSKSFHYNDPVCVENCLNDNLNSADVVPLNNNHSIVETYIVPEILASLECNVPIPSVENSQNTIIISADVVPQNDNYSMIETYVASKNVASKIPIPMVENRDNINSDLNIVTQNDNQHLCLYVMVCIKKRLMEYI